MNKRSIFYLTLLASGLLSACMQKSQPVVTSDTELSASTVIETVTDSLVSGMTGGTVRGAQKAVIEKALLYDRYTLQDTFPYKDTIRVFQWEQIRDLLTRTDSFAKEKSSWGILRNRRNLYGEAPVATRYVRDAYTRVSDLFGVERYQGIPLYLSPDSLRPERYGMDGTPVRITETGEEYFIVRTVAFDGEWVVPKRYVKPVDSMRFNKVIVVDRTNQNITSLEKEGSKWLVRSMNPATTGRHKPPYMQETPLGIFVIQEKKPKMIFLVDGTTVKGGFAPYACRFSNGGHIHGVPTNEPGTGIIEYSPSLGTTPRSHMCVRNATSHAKFIYDWADTESTLVCVIE